ncbi:MAG: arginine repressor [Firmicutes bacterium]|nr:arginine repressor [Bacillota bacterium]
MKTKRQSKILELIRSNDIDTQETLAEMLNRDGYNVTQATISRDIRELKITKVSVPNGGFKYAEMSRDRNETTERLARVLKEGIVSLDYAQNILVIKTIQGMAMAVAAAVDVMENTEIVGTIAGDDTIFCAVKSEAKAIGLIERLKTEITN